MSREVRELTDVPEVGPLLVKGLVGSARKRGVPVDELPRLSLLLDDQPQDVARLADYCRVTGFGLTDRVPATWLHVLTFPLQAALMADDAFPFALPGLVHVSNDMTLSRPVSVSERLRLLVRAENLRLHAKGAVFDMVGEVHASDEPVGAEPRCTWRRGCGWGARRPRPSGCPHPPSFPPSGGGSRLISAAATRRSPATSTPSI